MIAIVLATALATLVETPASDQIEIAQTNSDSLERTSSLTSGSLFCWQDGYRIIDLHNTSDVRESEGVDGTRYTGVVHGTVGGADKRFSVVAPAGSLCLMLGDSDLKPFFWSWK